MPDETLYDELRLAIHDILAHCKKTKSAFNAAARQVGCTPEQCLASLLARAVCEILTTRGSTGPSQN